MEEEIAEPQVAQPIPITSEPQVTFRECVKLNVPNFNVELYSSSLDANVLASICMQMKKDSDIKEIKGGTFYT